MIQIVEPAERQDQQTLEDYAADTKFAAVVSNLQAEAQHLRPRLEGRTIWMVNSTAQGGGVAEMLPRMLALINELGVDARWAVITTERQPFFQLTKRLHNLIHGDARAGIDFTADDRQLYEAVNEDNFASFKEHLGPDDLVVIHDPQPLPLGKMIADRLGLTVLWRCHIGLDARTEATRAAWRFLRPQLDSYRHAIFSVPEYIPSFLAGRASIIYPAIDPLSQKNRDLPMHKVVGIFCNSGLQVPYEPVVPADYEQKVQQVTPGGTTRVPGELGLLFRPYLLQVSRWDRLKGWTPLLEGFTRLKQELHTPRSDALQGWPRRRIELVRLVLAGPDPDSIADDPEGLGVLEEIRRRYLQLRPELQRDVALLLLPMKSLRENALIVNALQRCATVIAQNSLQEGFGLTATEGMWKHVPILGSYACGIRQQVRDGIDGLLSQSAEDPDEIAMHMRTLLVDPALRQLMGRSAQRRVYDEFLVFRQISRYLQLLSQMVGRDEVTGSFPGMTLG
jgi:trehalose synthase